MSYRNEGIHKDTIRDACPAGIGVRLFMEKEAHYFDAILMDIVMPNACKEAGMNDYLAKPVELQRLYQVLAEYLENPM